MMKNITKYFSLFLDNYLVSIINFFLAFSTNTLILINVIYWVDLCSSY